MSVRAPLIHIASRPAEVAAVHKLVVEVGVLEAVYNGIVDGLSIHMSMTIWAIPIYNGIVDGLSILMSMTI